MRKLPYFDPEWSMAEDTGTLESRLSVIADRYVGGESAVQPSGCVPVPGTEQFKQTVCNGSWKIDLASASGAGTDGYSIVGGMLMSGLEKTVTIGISCFSPTELI